MRTTLTQKPSSWKTFARKLRFLVRFNQPIIHRDKRGRIHCDDGPAVEWSSGTKEWYRNGEFHRDDGPAVERATGTKLWYDNGLLHRKDAPAIKGADGAKEWWHYGKPHRQDGPAYEDTDGTKEWWDFGLRHRQDGPAVENADGTVEYWLDGDPWPEGPRVIAERKAREEREKKEKQLQDALAHMRGVFNGAIPVDAKPISRLKIKPKSKPPQP